MANINAIRSMLAEVKRKYRDKRIEVKGLILLINELINPYEDNVEKIDAGQIRAYSAKLEEAINEAKEFKEKINAMESDLNG